MKAGRSTHMLMTFEPAGLMRTGPRMKIRVFHADDKSRFIDTWALIDTGATLTMINPKLVERLNLVFREEFTIETAGGKRLSKSYECGLEFVGINVIVPKITAVAVNEGTSEHLVLGRDFLHRVIFVYDGQGVIFLSLQDEIDAACSHKTRIERSTNALMNSVTKLTELESIKIN